jgi:Omp85 superfamily domain
MIYLVSARRLHRVFHFLLGIALLCLPAIAMAQDGGSADPPAYAQTTGGAPAAGPGLFTEPRLLSSAVQFLIDNVGEGGRPKRGWYPEVSNMITGAGFVSLGPGYRKYFRNDQVFFDGSAALSWHAYKMAQARVEAPDLANHHVTIGSQVLWQDNTQINYYGIGPDTLEADKSQYRLESTDTIGYAAYRPRESLSIGGKVGWLASPNLLAPGGTFKPTLPEAQQEFPDDPGMQLQNQPDFLHGQVSVISDTRDYPGHPTRGGMYRAALTTFSDRSIGTFSFRQYEGEALQFAPLSENWILAFHAWAVFSDVANGNEVPFYFLPTLGGHSTLRGYSSFRFHDNDLAMVSAESRWALFTHVDGALFFDAGNVAPQAGDLNLAKTDYGAGLRLHTRKTTWARFDVGHGGEGWHFFLRTSDALRLSRVVRRTVAAPFVP